MKKEVMILTGAGQIGMAIARRMGYGKKIIVGDLNPESAEAVCRILNEAGFDAVPVEMNLSSRESILNLIAVAREHGEISMLVNAAGVSPSQASIETILKVDLYGTAVLLEEVGKVIKEDGVGFSNSSVTWSKKFWCLYLLSITSDRICSMLVSGTVSSPSSGSTLEM